MRNKAIVSSCGAWVLWIVNWLTINGTVRNGIRMSGRKPGPMVHGFSDIWNLIAAVVATIALFQVNDHTWLVWLAVYRCAAIVVSQGAVLVNTDFYNHNIPREDDKVDNIRLLLIGLLHYTEIVLWFAVVYRHFPTDFHQGCSVVSLSKAWGALYFSTVTITTLGYGEIRPTTVEGARIVVFQMACGIFMTLVVLSRFVGLNRNE